MLYAHVATSDETEFFFKTYLVREGIRHYSLDNIKKFPGRPLFLEESLNGKLSLQSGPKKPPGREGDLGHYSFKIHCYRISQMN